MTERSQRLPDPMGTPLDIDGGTVDVENILAPRAPEIDPRRHHHPASPPASGRGSRGQAIARVPGAGNDHLPDPAFGGTLHTPVVHDIASTDTVTDGLVVTGDPDAGAVGAVAILQPATLEMIQTAVRKACHGSHRPLLKLLGLAGIGISAYRGSKSDEYLLRVWQPNLAVATHRPHEPNPTLAAQHNLTHVFPGGDADLMLIGIGDTDGMPLSLARRRAGSTMAITTAVAAEPTPADIRLLGALRAPDHHLADHELGDAWWAALAEHPAAREDAPQDTRQQTMDGPGPPSTSTRTASDAIPGEANSIAGELLDHGLRPPSRTTEELIVDLVDRLVVLARENGQLRAELRAAKGNPCDT